MRSTPPSNEHSATSQASSKEFRRLTIQKLVLAVILLVLLFVISGFISLFFEPEVQQFSTWLSEKFGFWALAGFLFLSDAIISPFPPDIALFFVAKSPLRGLWYVYVPILAAISTASGTLAWWLGSSLVGKSWAPKFIRQLPEKNKGMVKKFGPVLVALGALTPLPFSITCWSAGFLNMKYHRFFVASLFRFPRIMIAYWAIVYSDMFRYWFLPS